MIEIKDDTIKKTFAYKGEDNTAFLKNEVFWLNYLKGKWVPELLEVGNNYIVTRYYGRDLIEQKYMPDKQQVLDMFSYFKEKNVRITNFKLAIFHLSYVNIYFMPPGQFFDQNQIVRVFISIKQEFT